MVIVEDEPAHMERFRDNLRLDPKLILAAEYGLAQQAMDAIHSLLPDVALVDLGLPDRSGFDVIAHLHQTTPHTEIMVVSVFGGEQNLLRAIEAGATGYLLKDTLPADFNASIHALRAGESPISPSLARHLLRRFAAPAPESAPAVSPLSAREIGILEEVARGTSFSEIGQRLFISPHTVKTHVKNIYRKLEARSSMQAV